MPEGTSTNGRPVRLLPVVLPAPVAPPTGDWHRRGLCAGENPEVFFPSNGDSGARAREICTACPVREDCIQYATEADEFGIWGGLDQQQRRALKRRQFRQARRARASEGNRTEESA